MNKLDLISRVSQAFLNSLFKLDNTTLKSIDISRCDCYTIAIAGRLHVLD